MDKAGLVRKGEELNLIALIPWLESHIPYMDSKVSQPLHFLSMLTRDQVLAY
ncbi:MAG: hemerythrin [Congregibacter sp.]|jgi:hemerythrin